MPKTTDGGATPSTWIAPSDWRCDVHQRSLAYPEWKAGGCFWCYPELIPPDTQPRNGKLSKTADYRNKVYAALRNLSAFERTHPHYLWPKKQTELLDYSPPTEADLAEEEGQRPQLFLLK